MLQWANLSEIVPSASLPIHDGGRRQVENSWHKEKGFKFLGVSNHLEHMVREEQEGFQQHILAFVKSHQLV